MLPVYVIRCLAAPSIRKNLKVLFYQANKITHSNYLEKLLSLPENDWFRVGD